VGKGKINPSKTTLLIIIISVGFFVGVSFSSVYAGVLIDTEDIADNAITSDKIKDKQVKAKDIRTNAIKSSKIRDGAIISADIKDGTISSVDLAPGVAGVPIGTVLDWWCSADCTIPDGFVIADGQLISDPASPFDGENVPLLTNRFIRGVTNVGNVGDTGGASSHSHGLIHTHAPNSVAGHTHDVDPPSEPTSSDDVLHNHIWAFMDVEEQWTTLDDTKPLPFNRIMVDWTNGIGNAGDGFFPIGISCSSNNCLNESFHTTVARTNHSHDVDLSSTTTTASAAHDHGTSQGPNPLNTSNNPSEPPWFGLVKIIRIK